MYWNCVALYFTQSSQNWVVENFRLRMTEPPTVRVEPMAQTPPAEW